MEHPRCFTSRIMQSEIQESGSSAQPWTQTNARLEPQQNTDASKRSRRTFAGSADQSCLPRNDSLPKHVSKYCSRHAYMFVLGGEDIWGWMLRRTGQILEMTGEVDETEPQVLSIEFDSSYAIIDTLSQCTENHDLQLICDSCPSPLDRKSELPDSTILHLTTICIYIYILVIYLCYSHVKCSCSVLKAFCTCELK